MSKSLAEKERDKIIINKLKLIILNIIIIIIITCFSYFIYNSKTYKYTYQQIKEFKMLKNNRAEYKFKKCIYCHKFNYNFYYTNE